MITFLLLLIIVLAAIGLLLWGLSKIPGIPEIVKVIVYVFIGLILLVWLYHVVASGGFSMDLPSPPSHR